MIQTCIQGDTAGRSGVPARKGGMKNQTYRTDLSDRQWDGVSKIASPPPNLAVVRAVWTCAR